MLITGVEEQLGVVDGRDDLPGRVDVSLPDEDGVRVHAVDLDGDSVGPRAEGPVAGDRDTGVEQQRAASPGPGLRELLSRHLPEREPGVDEVARQVIGAADVPLQDLIESDLSGVGHALVQRGEGSTVVEVGDDHRVTSRPQLVGERAHPFGQALSVVEQQNVGHRTPSVEIERSRSPYAAGCA